MSSLELNKEPENTPLESVQPEEIQLNPSVDDIVKSETVSEETVAESSPVSAPSVTKVIPDPEIPEEMTENEGKGAVEQEKHRMNAASRPELIEALKQLLIKEVEDVKDEVEMIKQLFYKKVKTEHEEQRKAFEEINGTEVGFNPGRDELEEQFKNLLTEFRQKKAHLAARLEQEKENNLLQKQHILEQMKILVENNEDVSAHINEFRALQQKWKSIGAVPASAANDLWKLYNQHQEAFWDLIKINNELREYDFRKNFEAKTSLCEAAEKLINEDDVVSAFQKLQKLHEEWHELGPVSREMREEIWTRFKEASSIINKKHQQHFEVIREIEEKNYQLKLALCEKVEAFDISHLKTYKSWDEATQTILNWQEEWRSVGFAPRKVNQKIFERYRTACDAFFNAKTSFYREMKAEMNHNAELKRLLCEKAEALKESQDWKTASEQFVEMQKEWKTIGPASKKSSDELWRQFISACDYFFEQKNKNISGQRSAETENLTKKKDLIIRIKAFKPTDNPTESLAILRDMMAEWNAIGHVPFKEKDKVYKEYREAVDMHFDSMNLDASARRIDKFRTNLKDMASKGENKLYREREKLVRAYEHLRSEIATYENNIGFFSSNSKKGGGLIREMERKIEVLKEESKLIEQKINMLDDTLS